MMAAILFLTAGYTFKLNRHIKVVLLFNRFPPRLRNVLGQLQLIVFLAWVSVMMPQIWNLCRESFEIGSRSITVLRTPLWIPQAFFVTGIGLLWLIIFAKVIANLRDMVTKTQFKQPPTAPSVKEARDMPSAQ